MDAEHHLGQGDAGTVLVGRHAQTARQDQFGAAAHAGTVHRGHGGAGEPGQCFVHALAVLDVLAHGVLARVFHELADVRAHRKARGLARMDDDAGGHVDRQPLDDLIQLVQHGTIDRIDAAAGAVERQRHQAIVLVGPPVVESQSFEHGGRHMVEEA